MALRRIGGPVSMTSLRFTDVTLDAASGRRSTRTHDAATLVPAAVAVFDDLIVAGRDGDACHVHDVVAPTDVVLRLDGDLRVGLAAASFHSPALASRGGVETSAAPITTSVLLCGADPDEEYRQLASFEAQLHRTARGYGVGDDVELGYALTLSRERPLLATWIWPVAVLARDDLALVADMETCLAAAWFRRGPAPA